MDKNGFSMSDTLPAAHQSVSPAPTYHPSIAAIMRWFDASHLGGGARAISGACGALAKYMAGRLPANPETTAGLRKLLEAKDCFVRSAIAGQEVGEVAPLRETVTVYLGASGERMGVLGVRIGLDRDALAMFRNSCPEVKVDLELNRQTGETRIVAVDGRLVL